MLILIDRSVFCHFPLFFHSFPLGLSHFQLQSIFETKRRNVINMLLSYLLNTHHNMC